MLLKTTCFQGVKNPAGIAILKRDCYLPFVVLWDGNDRSYMQQHNIIALYRNSSACEQINEIKKIYSQMF